jgi:DNA repair exonuclease SbcCD nuclease subunit
MSTNNYAGLLLIGDPHLEGRQPGFRKDDYPHVVLDKLQWCLEYAAQHALLPAILGDLFDKPRDNPNWIIVRLLEILQGEVLAIYGNHDVHHTAQLTPDDSLNVLVKAGRLRMIDAEHPWQGQVGGRTVVVGGSSYRQKVPKQYPRPQCVSGQPALVIWLAHHDILVPGYDEGRFKPYEIDGIDLVINGHIHRRLEDVTAGGTLWITPGNISRRKRSDATREHIPSALRVDIDGGGYRLEYLAIPHQPFDEVFYAEVIEEAEVQQGSAFIAGLAELRARRTASGAGLMQFLDKNLDQFDPPVAQEIRTLAQEVMNDGEN